MLVVPVKNILGENAISGISVAGLCPEKNWSASFPHRATSSPRSQVEFAPVAWRRVLEKLAGGATSRPRLQYYISVCLKQGIALASVKPIIQILLPIRPEARCVFASIPAMSPSC
jgi:hypothetical protein